MRYTVVWPTPARTKLADLWNKAADRQAVTDASNLIDRTLKYVPLSVGRAVGPYRQLIIAPLQVWYEVSVDDCLVTVLDVSTVS